MDIATITISDADALARFAALVPVPGVKGERLRAASEAVAARVDALHNARADRLPLAVNEAITAKKEALGLSWTSLGYRVQGKEICRADLARVANTLASPELHDLATSDVLWDEIVSIVPDGECETFDVRVPATANFVANGLFTHNSGAVEQDANAIWFLHPPKAPDPHAEFNEVTFMLRAQRRGASNHEVTMRYYGARCAFAEVDPMTSPTDDFAPIANGVSYDAE